MSNQTPMKRLAALAFYEHQNQTYHILGEIRVALKKTGKENYADRIADDLAKAWAELTELKCNLADIQDHIPPYIRRGA